MKKRNYFKIGTLLICVFLTFWSCEPDDSVDHELESKTTTLLTFSNLPQNVLNTISELNPKNKLLGKKKTISLTLDYQQVIKMIDSFDNSNYSIKFTIPNMPKNVLYNLIIRTNENNIAQKPYIIKYTINNLSEITREDKTIDFVHMKATVKLFSYKKFISKMKSKGSDDSCITLTYNGPPEGVNDMDMDPIDNGIPCNVYAFSTNGEIYGFKWMCSDGSVDVYLLKGKTNDDCDDLNGGTGEIAINRGGLQPDTNLCPDGFTEDSEGKCVEKPCAGDPVKNPEISNFNSGINSNRFGCVRKDPTRTCNNIVGDRYHAGIDLKSDTGSLIYSISNGTVFAASTSSTFGNYLIIKKGNLFFLYAHLNSVPSISGTINKGDLIAISGESATVGEPHLHIEVRKRNGTESYNNMEKLNIENYLTTKFDQNGNSITNNCN